VRRDAHTCLGVDARFAFGLAAGELYPFQRSCRESQMCSVTDLFEARLDQGGSILLELGAPVFGPSRSVADGHSGGPA
jgi:hypothetical protein